MTNPSTQHEAAIQEGERIAAADEYFAARTWIMDTNDNRRIFEAGFDRAYALLSKLRTPVADELPGGTRWPVLRAMARNYTAGKHTWDALDAEACEQAAEEIRHLRAALASAPVSGEAQKPWGEIREDANGDLAIFTPNHNAKLATFSPGAAGEFVAGDSLYAAPQASATIKQSLNVAPQASEAVRDADEVLGSPLTPYGLLARALRAATGTTLMRMARETGSTPAEISNYEFGRKAPDEIWFERAAFFFASNGIVVSPTALRQAHERAALSAQPGAQKGGSDA